jgi:hypothetical protein
MDGRRARRVLGVAIHAGPDDIRRAFRARVQVVHPDHGGSSADLAEVVAAFELLKHAPAPASARPRHRVRVDVYDSAWRPAPRRDFADVLRAATSRLAG